MDMSQTVAPKSDQMNADDLIAGPRVIRITKVSGTGNSDQPVAVYFEDDNGKPFKPCKSMRRVMIAAWGADASQYVGRSMRLYRDPKVAFGGMEVGGIRISHMSDIERDMVMALTVTKAKRAPYTVKVLQKEASKPDPVEAAKAWAADLAAALGRAADAAEVTALLSAQDVQKRREWLAKKAPADADALEAAIEAAAIRFAPGSATTASDDGFPA